MNDRNNWREKSNTRQTPNTPTVNHSEYSSTITMDNFMRLDSKWINKKCFVSKYLANSGAFGWICLPLFPFLPDFYILPELPRRLALYSISIIIIFKHVDFVHTFHDYSGSIFS